MIRRRMPTFDVKCLDLADHFLADVPGHTEVQRLELAAVIQQAIEDELDAIEMAIAKETLS